MVKDDYLASGAELELFEMLTKSHPNWLSPVETAYISRSAEARRRKQKRDNWLLRGLAGAAVLLACAAFLIGIFYFRTTTALTQTREALIRAEEEEGRSLWGYLDLVNGVRGGSVYLDSFRVLISVVLPGLRCVLPHRG